MAGGIIYVADYNNHRVQRLNKNTRKFLLPFGKGEGESKGQLIYPHGVAVVADKLLVTERGNNRVSVFELEPLQRVVREASWMQGKDAAIARVLDECAGAWEFVQHIGCKGEQDGQFESPLGIAVSCSALVVSSAHRITLFAVGAEGESKRQGP